MSDRYDASGIALEKLESEKEDYLSSPPEYKILTYPADYTIEVLISKMRSEDIEIPTFQRGFVWSQAKATKLIESFLIGLPVPPVFLYLEPKTKKLLVIDGQQRLRTIHYFAEGYFGEPLKGRRTVFKLRHLNEKSKWYNRRYEDLTDEERRVLNNRVLRAFIVEQLDPQDNTSVYHIFERLNTGGILLNNQEIRNSLYHGKLNDLLKELNHEEDWRAIIGKRDPDNRQRDVELILRFLSLYQNFKRYEKPMKEFMNKYMDRHKNPPEEELKFIKNIFSKTCKCVRENLGDRPFHIRAGLNAAVFDAVFVSFANHLSRIPDNITSKYRKLVKREDFYKMTRDATTDVSVVHQRFKVAERALFR